MSALPGCGSWWRVGGNKGDDEVVEISSSVEYTADVEMMMPVYFKVSTLVYRMGSDERVTVVIIGSPNASWRPKSCSTELLLIYPATWYRQESASVHVAMMACCKMLTLSP